MQCPYLSLGQIFTCPYSQDESGHSNRIGKLWFSLPSLWWPHKWRSSRRSHFLKSKIRHLGIVVLLIWSSQNKQWIYGNIYVFAGEESRFIWHYYWATMLGNKFRKSRWQLPVQEVLEGTDEIVSYVIFEIISLFMFSRSENPLLAFLLSYRVRLTLENPGQLPVQRGTDDSVLWIFEISSVFMFSRSRNKLLAFLLSYRCSDDLD